MPKIDKPAPPPRMGVAAARALSAHLRTDPAAIAKREALLSDKRAQRAAEAELARLRRMRSVRGRLAPAQAARLAKLRRDLDSLDDRIYDARAELRRMAPPPKGGPK